MNGFCNIDREVNIEQFKLLCRIKNCATSALLKSVKDRFILSLEKRKHEVSDVILK